MSKLINIDNGGTLTDICVIDGDRIVHTKTITTPYDLSKCFIEGLKKASQAVYGEENLAALLQDTEHIRYSTTQGTNALVEKKGQRLGLIVDGTTTADAFQHTAKEGEMFAALVGGRLAALDTAQDDAAFDKAIVDAVNRITAEGAQRLVVSFSGADAAAKEQRFMRSALRLFPRHLLGAVPILYACLLSSDADLCRRTWTALNNAFLHPAMERFLYQAENLLRPYRMVHPLLIYRNDGYSGRVAKTTALRTYSSGPRGGMEGARAYARYYGFRRLLSFDVGGTTTDIGLVEDGVIRSLPRGDVEGVECSFPLCDIVSVGVGGGSIFRVVKGQITVGPDSVGGVPGPACFGLGGQEPTITDALLLMGLIDPATYFDGKMKLDVERARAVIETKVMQPLGQDLPATLHAMFAAWAKQIAVDLRAYTTITPDTVLSAFGGGGPLAALAVAEALEVDTVLVPRLAAVFSAAGIGFSDIAHSAEATLPASPDARAAVLAALSAQVQRDMFSEGFEADECTLEAWVSRDGKSSPLDLLKPQWDATAADADAATVISVRAVHDTRKVSLPKLEQLPVSATTTDGVRRLRTASGGSLDLPIVRVEAQPPGTHGAGPVVMEEAFWTCQVPAGWQFEFTVNGDVLFRRHTKG